MVVVGVAARCGVDVGQITGQTFSVVGNVVQQGSLSIYLYSWQMFYNRHANNDYSVIDYRCYRLLSLSNNILPTIISFSIQSLYSVQQFSLYPFLYVYCMTEGVGTPHLQ